MRRKSVYSCAECGSETCIGCAAPFVEVPTFDDRPAWVCGRCGDASCAGGCHPYPTTPDGETEEQAFERLSNEAYPVEGD
jgi:ribosomal protein L37AE/L43A